MVAGAPRLEMQAAQAEALGFVMLQHRIVRRHGAGSVAGELRGLGLEELGHRLVADQPARRHRRVLGGGAGVARADGEHAARQRLEALLPPARLRAERNQRRERGRRSAARPHAIASAIRQREDGGEREHQRDLVFLAPPGQVHDARIVRKPSQTSSGQRHRCEKNQQANHCDSASKTLATRRKPLAARRDLTVLGRPRAARPPPRGSTAAPRRPPAWRGPASANRPPPCAPLRGACRKSAERRAEVAAPACGLDLRDRSLGIVAPAVSLSSAQPGRDCGDGRGSDRSRCLCPRRRGRGQHMRRDRIERGGQRAVGGRPIDHGLQRRRAPPESTPRRCRAAVSSGPERRARARALSAKASAAMAIAVALSAAAGFSSAARCFVLGRGEGGLDLVDLGRRGRRDRGRRRWPSASSDLELGDPGREIRKLAPRSASTSARKSLACAAKRWVASLAAPVPGAGRLQRRHALVEVRCVGRAGAGLEGADPLLERWRRPRSPGWRRRRARRSFCRACASRAPNRFAVSVASALGVEKRVAGAEAERGDDQAQPTAPAEQTTKRQCAERLGGREGRRRGFRRAVASGGGSLAIRVAALRFRLR